MTDAACTLCRADGGRLVVRTSRLRLVHAGEAAFPGFYRVIWNQHAREFSDLAAADRRHCLEAVVLVEEAIRRRLQPQKVNLASLGNQVPHLHWHVVARYGWDSHFPAPVWAAPVREAPAARLAGMSASLPGLEAELAGALAQLAT